MNNNTSYETQAIDLSLLSVLDITKEGKVVSVEKWVELWTLVFQHINKIDAFCVDMQATLDNWHASEVALNEIIEDMQLKYASLSTGFTHYGEVPPQNPHIKFWVRRMEDIETHCFITNADIDKTYTPTSPNAQSGIAVAEALSGYVMAEVGKGLSTNDFTDEDKEKLYSALQNENIDKTYTPTSPNAQSGVATAEAVGVANDYTDKAIKSLKTYANNTFAPAIKNTVSDSVLAVHDVSPVEHDLGVSVRSKNLIDFDRIKNANEGLNGFDTVTKENNAVTVTDSNSDIGTTNMCPILELYKGALPEGTYTFSMDYEIENSLVGLNTNRLYLFVDNVASGTKVMSDGYGRCTFTFTLESASDAVRFDFYKHVNYDHEGAELDSYANDAVYKATFADIQLELGTTATEYTPYVADLSAVGVSRYGKNLFNVGESEDYFVGDSILNIENNTISGQIRPSAIARAFKLTNYPSGDYSVSFDVTQNSISILIRMFDSNGTQLSSSDVTFSGTYNAFYGGWITNNNSANFTIFTIPDTVDYWQLGFVFTGTSFQYATATNIQLEKGLNITSYEPYEAQTVVANADGIVEGLTSVSPDMTVTTDTEGVVIDMTYNADTKMYIDNKLAEISTAIVNS